MSEKKLSLTAHLIELRIRLIRSFIALGAGVAGSLYFSKEIFSWLQKPLLDVLPSNSSFITTNPVEPMIIYLKVSLLAGLFLSSPFIFYQLWRFISPGLFPGEKKIAFSFVLFSTLFFVGGALFGYFVIFPIGFQFFVALLVGTDIQLLPHMREYLGFISKMLLTFGLVFEMPVLLTLLARMGLVTRDQLKKARRYVIVLSFLIAGLLTPGPDVFSQLLLALPLLVGDEFIYSGLVLSE
ncbi:MAG: twin-arginine translocase subunit TatC [Deltaproteobacteria bacterium]|nr:twin-arginine translocase subunit TatC [Deltaproteobacteria bacterium]